MTKRYPTIALFSVPPDPRRKTPHLVIAACQGPYGPVELYCCAGTKHKRTDAGCRHTDWLLPQFKRYWRQRARPVFSQAEQEEMAS
jgi:hypothetical protein